MKAFFVLLVLLGIGYYYYFYRQPAPAPSAAPATTDVVSNSTAVGTPAAVATPARQSFDKLTALLHQDLQGIPALLDGQGHPPTNAVAIRRGLTSHESARPEYQTLARACDLIVQADARRTALQQACHMEQTRASFGGTLNGNSKMDHAVSTKKQPAYDPAKAQAEVHDKYESSWNSCREQTAGQVQSLLGSLADKQL